MKNSFKKLVSLLTVLVMAIALVAVPNVSANADEATSGTYSTANCWWGGGSLLVGYMAEDSTIGAMETEKGYFTEGGFPWWTAVVMDLQDDGNYLVTEVIPADGTNNKLDIALTTGRVVINFHSDAADAASVAFWSSVQAGDVLVSDASWEAMAAVEAVGNFTVYKEPSGTYSTANCWWGGGSLLVGYMAEDSTIGAMETEKGYFTEGGFPWWTAVVMDLQDDGNYLVTEVIPADGTNNKLDIALTTGRVVINFHSDAADADSVAFWSSVQAGDMLSSDASWEAMAAVEAVGNFKFAEVTEDEGTEDEGTTDDGTTTVGGTVHHVNAYDWTATSVYAFASADTTKNVNEMTGQKDGTFEYWTYIELDQNADGNYVVSAIYPPAASNTGDSVALASGKIVIMMHDSCTDVDSYAFFTSLTEGTVLSANATWDDMAATWGALDVTFTVVEDDTTDDGTTDDGATDDGATDDQIKETGDNFVPMFVVLFAGLAMIVVATVARKRA